MTSYPFDQDLIAFIDRDGATMFMLTAAGRARVQKNDRVRDWRSVSSSQLDPKGWEPCLKPEIRIQHALNDIQSVFSFSSAVATARSRCYPIRCRPRLPIAGLR